jgi:hypothetical protein
MKANIKGNIWDYHTGPSWVVVTTNGYIKTNGLAVMGRGIALQAAKRYPTLPAKLGHLLERNGNHVFLFKEYNLITFPVKHAWNEKADLNLIQRSVDELISIADTEDLRTIYLTKPGCGNGQLDWLNVEPLLKPLDNRFILIDLT